MNEIVIEELSSELNIKINQIKAVLTLLEEGSTIPFIARYRKEATGALDENQIAKIEEKYRYYNNLMERKETVIRLIDEKGMLTDEIKKNILNCTKLVEVEDIYLPYKEKKKTKATEAIKMGLEPLAKAIMAFPTKGSLESLCGIVPNVEKEVALENAKYIISEWVSDNAYYRKFVRNYIWNNASIVSKIKKNAVDEKKTYEIYYDFTEKVKYIKPYRVLAINRAEKENVISVKLDYDNDYIFNSLSNKIIKNKESFVVDYVNDAIKDALKRLIYPSIERDVRSELTEKSEDNAIEVFKDNLENLLMTRPVKGYRVLGFDPAFRTGCKLACLDEKGNVLHKDVIYPHEPKNEKEASRIKLLNLIKTYNINLIAIGNGTASRESEEFVANTIKDLKDVYYTIVSEAGASVYSASKEAQREFPDYEVQERSAVSIGRRVIDPLSELVKIDPKSIGVGEYQHDVNSKKLTESLDNTVSKVVNEVGVNINTASNFILKYVSGLTTTVINKIQKFKEKKELNSDIYTITDIIKELKNPGLDPRSEAPETILRSDVLTIDDLSIGMELKGTVRNVASFGAFVDIGLHDDGLLHISKMSKSFVKDPKDIVSVGDILTVYISDIDKNKGKVQLSLIK